MKKLLVMAASLALIITLSVTGTIAFKSVGGGDGKKRARQVNSQISTLAETDENGGTTSIADITLNINKGTEQLLPSPNSANMTAKADGQLWDNGAVKHYVTVENKGNVAVYVRTIIAIENPDGFDFDKLIKINYNANANTGTWEQIGDATLTDKSGAKCKFRIFTYTYKDVLTYRTDETNVYPKTAPSLKEIGLDWSATNEDIAKLGTDGLEIKVVSEAVDTSAGEKPFSEVTTEKNPWKDGYTFTKSDSASTASVSN